MTATAKRANGWKHRLAQEVYAFLGHGMTQPYHRAWVGPEEGPRFYLRHSLVQHEGQSHWGIVVAAWECDDPKDFWWFLDLLAEANPYKAVMIESVTENLAGHLIMTGWRMQDADILPPTLTKLGRKRGVMHGAGMGT